MPTARTTLTALAVAIAIAAGTATGLAGSTGSGPSRGAASTRTTTTTEVVPARPTHDLDETFAVDGGDLHISCRGAGSRTVVLVAGLGSAGETWDPVAAEIATTNRVCTYDRFGTGISDPAPAPQTFGTQARSLHQLLDAASEPGPYTVVGHSFGGLVAATYASLYPADVKGLLLLDASPTDWNAATCAVPDLGASGTDIWTATCAMQSNPASNPEAIDGPKAFAEAATIEDLGSIPLIVDQAADEGYTHQGLPDEIGAHLTAVWDRGQRRWATLSTAGRLLRIPLTTHQIHVDRPDVVIDQIQALGASR